MFDSTIILTSALNGRPGWVATTTAYPPEQMIEMGGEKYAEALAAAVKTHALAWWRQYGPRDGETAEQFRARAQRAKRQDDPIVTSHEDTAFVGVERLDQLVGAEHGEPGDS